jgi:hypothetical protein
MLKNNLIDKKAKSLSKSLLSLCNDDNNPLSLVVSCEPSCESLK